ncbi:hypothetical protein [Dapis sp. BLCC M229]
MRRNRKIAAIGAVASLTISAISLLIDALETVCKISLNRANND